VSLLLQREGNGCTCPMILPGCPRLWGSGSLIFQKCAINGETITQFMEFCMDRFRAEDINLMTVIAR
jgi:hypothetical protein